MYPEDRLQMARLRAAERANLDDARIWRWYSDLMEDRRVSCCWKNNCWVIGIDGCDVACSLSFDSALRSAYRDCCIHYEGVSFDL